MWERRSSTRAESLRRSLDALARADALLADPDLLRRTALWPAFGNHDADSSNAVSRNGPFFDMFSLPTGAEAGGVASGSEVYFSFDYANVHFVCLDSYMSDRSKTGPMLTWLETDLSNTMQEWIVCFFHHPPYSKGSHDSDDLFDSAGRLFDMRSDPQEKTPLEMENDSTAARAARQRLEEAFAAIE